jgi:tetratricopeptide (TPR) repeat protein
VKIHPRPQTLQELASCLSPEHRALTEHLSGCSRCREHFEALLNRRSGSLVDRLAEVLPWPAGAEEDYGRAIAAAEGRVLVHARSLAAERAGAPARLAELLEHPPERREMLIRNHVRFQTWGLLERLIEHAREQSFGDPLSAERLARLALIVADALDPEHYGAERIEDLRARAWGVVGNARRIRFENREAEEAFATAFTHLRRGTGDVLERAILLDLQASLRRAQRRPAEAERLLLRTLRIYREIGETHRMGRALVSLTTVYELTGTLDRAIPLLHEALKLIEPEREPRLLWNAYHNLIMALADAGRYMEAQGLLIQARPLYARFPDGYTQNRRHWVAGRIARGLGQARDAETRLQAARDGFLKDGATYDAAVVSLDLAELYAERGRTAELKQIAKEMLTIFSSRHIHREALAALAFLQQAALAERASVEVVAGIAAHLKRLRYDPELSLPPPD